MQEQTTEYILSQVQQQINELDNDDDLIGIFKKALIHGINTHKKFISQFKNLVIKQDDSEQNLC